VSPPILVWSSLICFGALAIGCGGRESARSPGADGGAPAPGAVDSGSPEASCPATYADVPEGTSDTSCPGTESCSYYDQFTCFCDEGSGWECLESNCLCTSDDGGCVVTACNSDADCPSGQHCGVNLGAPQRVCSAGCENGKACPAGTTCKMFAP
jgi:hypothetical protein